MSTQLKQSQAAAEMSSAALKFLDSLTPAQRSKATFPFGDGERIFIHHPPLNQKGVPLKEMDPKQKELAFALLATALTDKAYRMARQIMENELILREEDRKRKGKPARWPLPPGYILDRDPEFYFFTVFGPPGGTEPWGWRVQGHHLSLNFSLAKGELISTTPCGFGNNPTEVLEGPKMGLRILQGAEDLALKLMNDLDKSQKAKAILHADPPWELITYNASRAVFFPNEGLSAAKMSSGQKKMLQALVAEYVGRVRPEVAQQSLDKLEKEGGVDSLSWSWAGPIDINQCHWYRLTGQYFMIEFVRPEGVASHIHSVWRNVLDDFGLYGSNNLSHLMLQHHFDKS